MGRVLLVLQPDVETEQVMTAHDDVRSFTFDVDGLATRRWTRHPARELCVVHGTVRRMTRTGEAQSAPHRSHC